MGYRLAIVQDIARAELQPVIEHVHERGAKEQRIGWHLRFLIGQTIAENIQNNPFANQGLATYDEVRSALRIVLQDELSESGLPVDEAHNLIQDCLQIVMDRLKAA